jgi:hypothetical protein
LLLLLLAPPPQAPLSLQQEPLLLLLLLLLLQVSPVLLGQELQQQQMLQQRSRRCCRSLGAPAQDKRAESDDDLQPSAHKLVRFMPLHQHDSESCWPALGLRLCCGTKAASQAWLRTTSAGIDKCTIGSSWSAKGSRTCMWLGAAALSVTRRQQSS